MATIPVGDDRELTPPIWKQFFSLEEYREMEHDDSVALTRVCTILISIVAGGLCIGIIGLLLAL